MEQRLPNIRTKKHTFYYDIIVKTKIRQTREQNKQKNKTCKPNCKAIDVVEHTWSNGNQMSNIERKHMNTIGLSTIESLKKIQNAIWNYCKSTTMQVQYNNVMVRKRMQPSIELECKITKRIER